MMQENYFIGSLQFFKRFFIGLFLLSYPFFVNADIILSENFSSGVIPSGWTVTPLQGSVNWQVRNAPIMNSPSAGHYAVFDRFELGSVSQTHEAVLVTPSLDCSGRSSVHINLHHFWFGVESTNAFLEVSNNGGASWNIVSTYESATHGSLAAPEDVTFDLTAWAANESDVQVRFRYLDNGLLGRYWYVDDITIYTDPDVGITDLILPDYLSCGTSYGASETVTVEITNFGFFPVSNIPVECDVTGGATATLTGTFTGTILPGQTANLTFATTIDMSAEAIYDFNATTNLPTDQFTANDSYYTSRQQLVQTYPYLADFNGTHAGWFATGQDPPLNNGRNFVHGEVPFLNGPQGEGDSWYVEAQTDNVTTWIWVESPVFDLTGMVNPQFFIDLKHRLGSNSNNQFRVEYSINGGSSWVVLGANSDPNWYIGTGNDWRQSHNDPVDEWTTYQNSLCNLVGESCVKFRVYGRPRYINTNFYDFAFDNVRIEDGPDVGVIAITEPDVVECPSLNQFVTIEVYNYGCAPVSNVPVVCEITGAGTATLTGTVPGPIPAGESVSYTFPSGFNMTTFGNYDFLAYTVLPGDIHPPNDGATEEANIGSLLINTYPYLEDFNSGAGGWQASGDDPPLNNGRNFELGPIPYLNGPQGEGDSWYVDATGSAMTYIWVESPAFDFSNLANPTLSMDIKHDLSSNSNWFRVEYSIDGGNSWSIVGAGPDPLWYNEATYWRNTSGDPADQWTHVEQELCELSGETCVKFRIYGRPRFVTSNWYFAFDNFSIDEGIPDDVRAAQIILPNAGNCSGFSSTETVSVLIENMTCLPIGDFPIELQVNGGPVITETVVGPVPREGFYIHTFSTTVDLSAPGTHTLSATTMLASDGNTANDNVTEQRFNQTPITSFPYLEDFNTGNGGWVSSTTNDTRAFLLDTIPFLNGPQGEGDSWYAAAKTNNVTAWIWVESPVFDLTGMVNPQFFIDLKHRLGSHSNNQFRVEYSINGGSSWVVLGTNSDPNWYIGTGNDWRQSHNDPVDEWTTYQNSLCNLVGQSCVKFRVYGRPRYINTNFYDFAFDNVRIEDAPDVGVIAFHAPIDQGCLFSDEQEITIEVYNFGCSASNVPVVCEITGANTTTLTGNVPGPIPGGGSVLFTFPTTVDFTPIGIYDLEAYTDLPTDNQNFNDTSYHSVEVDQITITNFPYYQDFNSGPAFWLPSGQAPPLNNGRNFELGPLPYLNGPEGQGDSWFVQATGSATTYIWVESPVFDFSSLTNPKLNMDIKHNLSNSSNWFRVEYSINGGSSWITLGSNADPLWYNEPTYWRNTSGDPADSWTNVELPLCGLAGQPCVKFRVYGRPRFVTSDWYFAFDNFHITDTPIDAAVTFMYGCHGSEYGLDVTVFNNDRLCLTSPDITSIDLTYMIDGSTPVTQTFTGLNIPFGSSDVITIPGITIPSPASEVTVWCSLPNGLVDQINLNDTMTVVAGVWPDCNDHCSNATQLSIGTTSASQTSNATVTPGEEPAFACDGSITLENTVWFFFETGSGGAQDIEVIFENTQCFPNISTAGIQVSINEISGLPCDPANYAEVFCDDPGNSNDISWNAGVLPPNTLYYITIDGFAGSDCDFDITITGTGLTPLPVDLTSFTAVCEGKNRQIAWSTASEQNSHYFEVQRSLDGSSFELIGTVDAAGNSNHHLSYSFTDEEKGLGGIIYYRLKQVDFDGQYRIYPAVSVVCASDEMLMQLYPNPTSTSSELYIYSEEQRNASLRVLNSEGRIVMEQALQLSQGDNSIELDASSYAPGVYPIQVSFDDQSKHIKWVVVK